MEYSIALQQGKKPYHEGDHAPDPLFTHVDESVFSRPTFSTFLALLVSKCVFHAFFGLIRRCRRYERILLNAGVAILYLWVLGATEEYGRKKIDSY